MQPVVVYEQPVEVSQPFGMVKPADGSARLAAEICLHSDNDPGFWSSIQVYREGGRMTAARIVLTMAKPP
mgnify:CR=1 FL=1